MGTGTDQEELVRALRPTLEEIVTAYMGAWERPPSRAEILGLCAFCLNEETCTSDGPFHLIAVIARPAPLWGWLPWKRRA